MDQGINGGTVSGVLQAHTGFKFVKEGFNKALQQRLGQVALISKYLPLQGSSQCLKRLTVILAAR